MARYCCQFLEIMIGGGNVAACNRNPKLVCLGGSSSWPMIALWLYQTRSVSRATIWTILGGFLLLPVGAGIKFQGIPGLDKVSIPNLAALVGCLLVMPRALRRWNKVGLPEVLIVILLIGPFITSLFNGDSIKIGPRILPGIGLYDSLSAAVTEFIVFIPFILGRQFLRSSADIADILHILVIAGLAYSIPMLFEVRMSPQLHAWIYGYFPHEMFLQQMRDRGFRPVVFLGHGLLTAFFAMTTAVAAAAFWRTQTRIVRLAPSVVTAYLSVVLILCKSLGALAYGVVLVPLVRWAKPRLQMRMALILVTIALLYPILRVADLVPTSSMVEVANGISEERAASLKSRFDQEDQLIARAVDRFLFGWGRWGRYRIYDEGSGNDVSVTDGRWIITLGQFGLIELFAEFGLFALPVFRAASALKFTELARDRVFLAALALILAINMVDLLPNSGLTPWTWLIAGALLGRAEALRAAARQRKAGL